MQKMIRKQNAKAHGRDRSASLTVMPIITSAAASMLLGSVAMAEPADISVTNETLYSTNAGLREDKESDVRNRTTLDFYKVLSRTRFSGDIGFNLGYEYYFNDVFQNDSDLVAAMDVNAAYEYNSAVKWILRDTLNQVRRDSREVGTPDNRELINVFETGPQFLLPITGRTGLRLGLEYENLWFEKTDDLSNRFTGTASVVHELVSGHQIEAGVEADRAWIEREDSTGFDQRSSRILETDSQSQTVFGQISRKYRDLSYSARGGYTFVKTTTDGEDTEFHGPTSELSLSYGGETIRGLIDARLSHSLSDTFSDQNVKTFDSLDTRDRFDTIETTQFRLLGSYPLTMRDEISAVGSVSIERYQQQEVEEERYTAEVIYSHIFEPQFTGELSFRRDQENFDSGLREATTYYFEGSLQHRPFKNLRLQYSVGYTEREEDKVFEDLGGASVGLNGIEEVYVSFGITYFRL